ncbi:MAG: dienelactone hydrolase family protein [Algoriphagus sp.]|uniref:dienelactone hydrolase family protein n=1 Tax=Algoriphagus sp. TaxID=1872435 RepID=UPI0026178DA3|nr:dienelactone hydrolase family protein [Algoriphagus sp.]MDG1278854.1 dienelactone hydrolase family protein [Algoriphagus sp.]
MKNNIDKIELVIPLKNLDLKGILRKAVNPRGMIIFCHGSGSSRLSSRNNFVADQLLEAGYSSLLFDLLTEEEDLTYENRFNIDLLTRRLVDVTEYMIESENLKNIPIGYFGASTGAASALFAAATLGQKIGAIVSRGGRPDMAMPVLDKIGVPTLLIVGGDDYEVIELNQKAFDQLDCIKKLEIVEGATHLFGEPGKLEEVAQLTIDWFDTYLTIK